MEYDSIRCFHQACQNIIDNKDSKAVNYAVIYARAGLEIDNEIDANYQALYIISNIAHWRGAIANETRSILKNIINKY